MTVPSSYPFTRYLSAKKTVDDRALNKNVWESLKGAIGAQEGGRPVKVLEIGAGIGTMLERALEWELLRSAEYTAIDSMQENVEEALGRIPRWAMAGGYEVTDGTAGSFRLKGKGQDVLVRFETADVFDFMDRSGTGGQWDLLIANAFLDLVDVPASLPRLLALLRPGGLFYFTITFDGASILQPEIDPAIDASIEALYHETMDRRIIGGKQSGDSKTGRHLFMHLQDAGGELKDAGASDWVVFAGSDGYIADEAFFLHFIIHTMGLALKGNPGLDGAEFDRWLRIRHEQIENGALVYIAHQMDFLGRAGKG
jgi:SAM-dependent methyltransferase